MICAAPLPVRLFWCGPLFFLDHGKIYFDQALHLGAEVDGSGTYISFEAPNAASVGLRFLEGCHSQGLYDPTPLWSPGRRGWVVDRVSTAGASYGNN